MKSVIYGLRKRVSKPKNEDTIGEFRYYLRDTVFPVHIYDEKDCIETFKTAGCPENEIPDKSVLVYVSKMKHQVFCLISTYHEAYVDDAIVWCSEKDLECYRKMGKYLPTFFALGVGGHPGFPRDVYIFPTSKITKNRLTKAELFKYNFKNYSTVHINYLMQMLEES